MPFPLSVLSVCLRIQIVLAHVHVHAQWPFYGSVCLCSEGFLLCCCFRCFACSFRATSAISPSLSASTRHELLLLRLLLSLRISYCYTHYCCCFRCSCTNSPPLLHLRIPLDPPMPLLRSSFLVLFHCERILGFHSLSPALTVASAPTGLSSCPAASAACRSTCDSP